MFRRKSKKIVFLCPSLHTIWLVIMVHEHACVVSSDDRAGCEMRTSKARLN